MNGYNTSTHVMSWDVTNTDLGSASSIPIPVFVPVTYLLALPALAFCFFVGNTSPGCVSLNLVYLFRTQSFAAWNPFPFPD